MSRVSPQVWMSRIVFCTGIIGACMAGMQAAWSFYLLRLLLGIVIAGMWPGMTYYLTLFYPPARLGKRIGQYFTAAQLSAAVVGLVSAGFQLMDGAGGLLGWQWMFLLYGLVGVLLGIALLWWLPDRPLPPLAGHQLTPQQQQQQPATKPKWYHHLTPRPAAALSGADAELHYRDLEKVYHSPPWTLRDLWSVLQDWRLWPLTVMYFGVVGVGIGTQNYGTVILSSINPNLTGVQLSLLFAPIWIVSFPFPPSLSPPKKPPILILKTNSCPLVRPPLHPPPHPALRPLPKPHGSQSAIHILRAPANRRSPPHNPLPATLDTLRRVTARRLRPRPHRTYHHDVDEPDLPAATRAGGCCCCDGPGFWPG